MAYIPQSGSVVAFQGNPSALQVLIQNPISINPASISGTVGASVIGSVPINPSSVFVLNPVSTLAVNPNPSSVYVLNPVSTLGVTVSGNPSISGQVGASVVGHAPVVIVGGSILTSSTPNQSVSGTVQVDVRGSVAVAIISGSVAVTTGNSSVQVLNFPANQSVSGTVGTTQQGTWISSIVNTIPSSVIVGASIFGQLPAGTAMLGSVVAYQGVIPWTINSIYGNISGSVVAVRGAGGTWITSLVSTVPSSVIVGTSIFGQLPAGTAPLGSVAVLQGTNPWMINPGNSSMINLHIGSIITVFQAPSIVGTYAEDAAHTAADKGIFILGVRNDAVTSISGADRDYAPVAVDEASRQIVVPFAGPKACIISYVGSLVSGSVTLIKASVIGSRTYVTDFFFSNTGATTTLATIQDGTTSIMGQFIVPAGGGFSAPGLNIPLTPVVTAGSDLCWKVSPSSSVVYLTLKGYQAP